VRIERQPMDLLILLAQRRPQLVTREEIVEKLWGDGVHVDVETGVHTAIRKIRLALRDPADAPACIETVTGKGYRFIAPVEATPPTEVDAASTVTAAAVAAPPKAGGLGSAGWTRLLLALLTLSLAGAVAYRSASRNSAKPSRVTVAVLPFENLSGDPAQEYLADGLAEETIASFGQFDPERVGVIGRTSTLGYKGTRKSLAQIGTELGADYLVEGSLRGESGRLRITSRLVRASDQTQVWSASFDREPTSVVALQRELSAAIAGQVRLRLSPARQQALERRQTSDAEAYDLYLRGRFFWNQLTPATNARALEYFDRAIASDPEYGLAWAGIASVLIASTINSDVPPTSVRDRALEAAERAVAVAPDLAEAHAAMGSLRFMLDWNWAAAETSLRRSIELDPGNSLGYRMLGHVLSQAGRQDEATTLVRRSREIDPLDAMNHSISSQVAFQGRDFERAAEHALRAVAVDPEFWIGHVQLAQAYEQLGRADGAVEALGNAARFSANNSKALSFRGHVLAKTGRAAEARAVLKALEAAARGRYVPPYALALVHAGLGDRDAVLARLAEACEARDVHLIFIELDPKWDAYRDDPRFQALLKQCGVGGDAAAR
jgi:TolB-like protein/DNA-binding winged helix-turn-helix (wHTH) protein/tetratricopeptide (TPR) repeat protein